MINRLFGFCCVKVTCNVFGHIFLVFCLLCLLLHLQRTVLCFYTSWTYFSLLRYGGDYKFKKYVLGDKW